MSDTANSGSDLPYWVDTRGLDLPTEFPPDKLGPLLPADYYSKSPVLNAALSSVFGPLPWLRDPDKPYERMQLWPERTLRSALTLPSDVVSGRVPVFDPETGHVNTEVINRAQDMSALVMGSTGFGAPKGSFGAGPTLPEAPRAPTWFTGIERELLSTKRGESKVPESGTMRDWQEYLGKRVKPDEIKWLLRPQEAQPDARFTRGEIAQRVAANKPKEYWKTKSEEDEDEGGYYASQQQAVDVRQQWEEAPPVLEKQQIAHGIYNILDQHGNVVARHVAEERVDRVIQDNNAIVERYRRRGELDPEDQAEAVQRFDDLAMDTARNKEPEGFTRYGPDQYPEYSLPGAENYREAVFALPTSANHEVIADYKSAKANAEASLDHRDRLGRQWSANVDAIRNIDENMPAPVRLLNQRRRQALIEQNEQLIKDRAAAHAEFEQYQQQREALEPEALRAMRMRSEEFQSSHWDEPNAMSHMRLTDRYIGGQANYPAAKDVVEELAGLRNRRRTPEEQERFQELALLEDYLVYGGEDYAGSPLWPKIREKYQKGPAIKSLHSEEFQSDWHQQGQDGGYIGDPRLVRWEQVQEAVKLQEEILDSLDQSMREKQPGLDEGRDPQVYKRMTNGLLDTVNAGERDPLHTPEEHQLAQQWHDAVREETRLRNAYNSQKPVPDAPFKATWPDLMLKRMLRQAIDEGYDAVSWTPGLVHAERWNSVVHDADWLWLRAPTGRGESGGEGAILVAGRKGERQGTQIAKDIKTKADITKVVGDEGIAESIWNMASTRGVLDSRGVRYSLEQDGRSTEDFLTARGRRMVSFYDKQLVDKMNAIVGKYGAKVERTNLEIQKLELTLDPYARKWMIRDVETGEIVDAPHAQDGLFESKELAQKDLDKLSTGKPIFIVKLNDKMRQDVQAKGFPLFSGLVPVVGNPFDYDWNKSAGAKMLNYQMQQGPRTPYEANQWQRMFPPRK